MSAKKPAAATPEDALAALLARTPVLAETELRELESAIHNLDLDPAFVADYLKGLFVEDVRRALDEDGVSQNALADRLGKTRQYLSKILDQHRRVNFTIDTMAEISVALKRRLFLRMLGPSETATIFRVTTAPQTVLPLADIADRKETNLLDLQAEFAQTGTSYTPKEKAHDCACM